MGPVVFCGTIIERRCPSVRVVCKVKRRSKHLFECPLPLLSLAQLPECWEDCAPSLSCIQSTSPKNAFRQKRVCVLCFVCVLFLSFSVSLFFSLSLSRLMGRVLCCRCRTAGLSGPIAVCPTRCCDSPPKTDCCLSTTASPSHTLPGNREEPFFFFFLFCFCFCFCFFFFLIFLVNAFSQYCEELGLLFVL